MANPQLPDPIVKGKPLIPACDERFHGKRAGMVTFSHYPGDPRPRRAIDALVSQGIHVDLICLKNDNAPSRENSRNVNVLRVPIRNRRGGKLSYAYQYSAFILISSLIFAWRALTRGYDIIYVNNMPDILVVSALVPKALGAKVILDLHDPMPELMTTIFGLKKESLSVRFISWIEKWSMARAHAVLTVNIACKRIFSSRSCAPEKIGVVMNSPDEKIFPLREIQSQTIPEQARKARFVIMYHGSIVERNGLDLAVEALSIVREAVPAVELRIYGPSTPFLERVMDNAKAKRIDEAIRYLGPRRLEDLVREIEDCDIGVIPNPLNSFTEINTPTRIFEYLALGKPVIAPSTPGIRDYFGQESLLFFQPGNGEDLAKRIEYAFSHRVALAEIARRGQEVYREHNWTKERERLIGEVAGLLEKQQARKVTLAQTTKPRMQRQPNGANSGGSNV